MKKVKLGLAQLLVEGGEPKRNLQRAESLIVQAHEKNCDIVLLPETLDFAWTHPAALKESLPVPGEYSNFFSNLAKKHSLYLCYGLTERIDNKNFNSVILMNPKGEIILKQRKINLLEVEFPFYEIGTKLEVIDLPWGRFAINICSDNYSNSLEIGSCLARMGAQVILSPSSWTVDHSITEEDEPYSNKWTKPYQFLASKFNIVVAGTTSVGYIVGGPYQGKKMVGCSLVVGPNGVLAKGQFNEFAGELKVVDIDIPLPARKGVQIGEHLKTFNQGFFKDTDDLVL